MENGNNELTPEEKLIVHQEYLLRRKHGGTLLMLWLLLGGFGGHRFYLGHFKIGILLAMTFGGFGVGLSLDLFLMWMSLKKHNETLKLEITERMAKLKAAENAMASTASVA